MEKFALTLQSQSDVAACLANRTMTHERIILNGIATAIAERDLEKLAWFTGFSDGLRAILMNVYAYRRGLEFGFTEIAFNKYGWFIRPKFLDYEVVKLGNSERYGEYSEIRISRGVNGIWSYAISYSYGCKGGGSVLSVYDPQFPSRETALTLAITKLKVMFTAKIGSTDTTNHKQEYYSENIKSNSCFKSEPCAIRPFLSLFA